MRAIHLVRLCHLWAILAGLGISLLSLSCARKTETARPSDSKQFTNPYTKKEYEKAREVNLGIPVEKQ